MSILTIASIICLLSTMVFIGLYCARRWFETQMGWSIMLLAMGVAGLSVGGLVYGHVHTNVGEMVLAGAYLIVSAVMAWRTCLMWRTNHPKVK